MDWDAAIERHRAALKRVLAMLVAMAGLAGTGIPFSPPAGRRWPAGPDEGHPCSAATLPRHLHRAVLRLLRPAESAARRLVIVVARELARTEPFPPPSRALRPAHPLPHARGGAVAREARRRGGEPRSGIAFPLFDPPRRPFRPRGPTPGAVPRIWFAGAGEPFPVRPPSPRDDVDATRLALRLAALSRALDDLPAQARRFARWRARAHDGEPRKSRRARRVWPLRAGRPPGQRPAKSRRPAHEVHDILQDLHGLAFDVLENPDTS